MNIGVLLFTNSWLKSPHIWIWFAHHLMQHPTETSFIHMNFRGAMQCGEVKFASSLSICTGFFTYIYIYVYVYVYIYTYVYIYIYICICIYIYIVHIYIYIVHIHTHVARLYVSSDAYDMISIYIYMYTYLFIYHTMVSACHAKHQHSHRLP